MPVAYDSELSWAQLAADVCLCVAAGITLLLALRLRRVGREAWTVVAVGVGMLAFLAWREVELDGVLFDVHMFSFAYLLKSEQEVSLTVKLGLGIPGLLIAAGAAWWLWTHRRPIARHLGSVLRNPFVVLPVAAVVMFLVAQSLDRASSWERNFGIVLPGADEPDKRRLRNLEEILELVGAVWCLCGAIELRVNLLARGQASEQGKRS
ncbi:MAG: hypothetical protein KGY99_05785 [Phycisphaerae bacterium]|nr:hypothetical protein [Phycisphaerae bacterium]